MRRPVPGMTTSISMPRMATDNTPGAGIRHPGLAELRSFELGQLVERAQLETSIRFDPPEPTVLALEAYIHRWCRMSSPAGSHWELSEDKSTITVSFPSTPPVALRLTTKAVDELIHNLARLRSYMTEPHPMKWQSTRKVTAVTSPPWHLQSELMFGHCLLHIRHPGYGWLHFAIPKPESAKLAGFLQARASEQDKPPQKKN